MPCNQVVFLWRNIVLINHIGWQKQILSMILCQFFLFVVSKWVCHKLRKTFQQHRIYTGLSPKHSDTNLNWNIIVATFLLMNLLELTWFLSLRVRGGSHEVGGMEQGLWVSPIWSGQVGMPQEDNRRPQQLLCREDQRSGCSLASSCLVDAWCTTSAHWADSPAALESPATTDAGCGAAALHNKRVLSLLQL